MHRSSSFTITTLATTAFFAGCAQKQVMAPPPPAPALAQAPTVQAAPPAPPAAPTASAQVQLKDLLAQALNPIYFDYNQSKVKPAGEEILGKIGQILKAHPELGLVQEPQGRIQVTVMLCPGERIGFALPSQQL